MPRVHRHFPTVVLALVLAPCAGLADPASEAQVLLSAPDVSYSGAYDLPCRPALLDSLLRRPGLLGALWAAYGFAPAYRVREQGERLHVEDPTGIVGDISLVQQAGNRWVFVGDGALNHRLAPAFRGKMAMVLTTAPKGTGTGARLEVFLRTENRALGLLAWAAFPLIRGRIENRVSLNLRDVGTILSDLSTSPKQTGSRLSGEDAAVFTRMFLPPPPR